MTVYFIVWYQDSWYAATPTHSPILANAIHRYRREILPEPVLEESHAGARHSVTSMTYATQRNTIVGVSSQWPTRGRARTALNSS